MLLLVILILMILVLIWHFSTLKYLNPYKQNLYIGVKGTGKTTTMTKWIYYYLKRGYTVYTDATDIFIPGIRVIDINDLGHCYAKGPKVVFFIDELARYFDNRQFNNKEYNQRVEKFMFWLKAVRHDKCIVYMFCQDYSHGADVKIRTQCDRICILQKYARVLTVGRMLKKSICMKDTATDADTQISQHLEFEPFFVRGAWEFTYIPKWSKMFDTYSDIMPGRSPLKYHLVDNNGNIENVYHYVDENKEIEVVSK